jgi:hypothetical protein
LIAKALSICNAPAILSISFSSLGLSSNNPVINQLFIKSFPLSNGVAAEERASHPSVYVSFIARATDARQIQKTCLNEVPGAAYEGSHENLSSGSQRSTVPSPFSRFTRLDIQLNKRFKNDYRKISFQRKGVVKLLGRTRFG